MAAKKIISRIGATLDGFVKDNCANYDRHYRTCLDGGSCKVIDGKRCGYFERCVLGPPDYKYRLPGYDYAKLFAQYAERTKAEPQFVEQRRCACGNPIKPRQRFCDTCRQNRRRATYQKTRQRQVG